MKNQSGLIQYLLIIGIVVAAGIIGYVLYTQRLSSPLTRSNLYNPQAVPTQYQNQYQQSGQAVAPIQNTNDLNSAGASLDSTDMSQIDAQLNALNTESSGF